MSQPAVRVPWRWLTARSCPARRREKPPRRRELLSRPMMALRCSSSCFNYFFYIFFRETILGDNLYFWIFNNNLIDTSLNSKKYIGAAYLFIGIPIYHQGVPYLRGNRTKMNAQFNHVIFR